MRSSPSGEFQTHLPGHHRQALGGIRLAVASTSSGLACRANAGYRTLWQPEMHLMWQQAQRDMMEPTGNSHAKRSGAVYSQDHFERCHNTTTAAESLRFSHHKACLPMKALPNDVVAYQRTPEFTEQSVPAGLLHSHSTKAGVWGKIVVVEGTLTYRILEPAVEELLLSPELQGVVEPTIKHEVAPQGRVRFYVEFYRAPSVSK